MLMQSANDPEDRFHDTEGAAAFLRCSAGYLVKLRGTGGGPDFHRLGKRKGILYRERDLIDWRGGRRFGSTSEYPEA